MVSFKVRIGKVSARQSVTSVITVDHHNFHGSSIGVTCLFLVHTNCFVDIMRFSSTTVYALAIVLPAWTEAFAFIPTITVRDPSNLLSRSSLLIRKAECVSRDGKDPSDEDEEKGPINPYELEFIGKFLFNSIYIYHI